MGFGGWKLGRDGNEGSLGLDPSNAGRTRKPVPAAVTGSCVD